MTGAQREQVIANQPSASDSTASRRAPWRREWLLVTVVTAAIVTVVDAVLLQESRSLFTGGFLVDDHLAGPIEGALFLVGGLITDAGLTGVGAAVGLFVGAVLGLAGRARRLLGSLAGATPLLVASIVDYQVLKHLGGAFDAALMFDLAGRRPEEFLAVASAHVLAPVALGALGLVGLAGLLWSVHRRWPAGVWPRSLRPGWRNWLVCGSLSFLLGLAVSTAMRLDRESFDNGLRRKPSGRAFGAVVAFVSDVDRDGYGLFGRPGDPAPFDARIYPYAVDWPGNGIDENGVAGDLPAGTPPWVEPHAGPPRFLYRPPVVLFVLETFRADLLEALIDGRPVTPVLRELARRGISSSFAYSLNGYTVQARFHQFSGSLAGLRGTTTIIDDFQANGYQVAYFSGQDESFGTDGAYDIGFSRADVAYDARQDRSRRYSTFTTPGSLAVPLTVVQQRIGEFLESRRDPRPLFLYVNFHDTHFPYHHDGIQPMLSNAPLPQERIAPEHREALWTTYANTAANVDRAIGEVLADLTRALGVEPGVIVTADHGESLYDEGFLGHGYALNDAQTRVPLVVANLPMRIREPFGQADLRDALLDSLTRPPGAPWIDPEEGPPVFQYLGGIDRPRQVAFVSRAGRTLYDFRVGRFRMSDGEWQRETVLEGPERDAFLELVRTWERIRLGRAMAQTSR